MKHKFVEHIPREIENDTLYISLEFNIAKHKCPCGCGLDVVTKISPARWQLFYDGETITLSPSIGNWNFECKSHYFIRENQVVWAKKFTEKQIETVQNNDKSAIDKYISTKKKKNILDWFLDLFKN